MDGRGRGYNTTHTVQRLVFCQARVTKYMGRLTHDHWSLRILHSMLAPIRAGHQTLEVNLVKASSNRNTIYREVYGTDAETMELRRSKFTGKVKERYFIMTYFSKTRPF